MGAGIILLLRSKTDRSGGNPMLKMEETKRNLRPQPICHRGVLPSPKTINVGVYVLAGSPEQRSKKESYHRKAEVRKWKSVSERQVILIAGWSL